jgi:hypothetical protein
MKEPVTTKKSTFEKVTSDLTKTRESTSISKKVTSYSKKKSDNLVSNKSNINSVNINLNAQAKPDQIVNIEIQKFKDEEVSKIKSLEEKITDYNEKEAFSNLIKYAKKGDRVGFINTIEM